jgi:hypothetical protein
MEEGASVSDSAAAELFESYIGEIAGGRDHGKGHFERWLANTAGSMPLLGVMPAAMKEEEFAPFFTGFSNLRASYGADWADSIEYRTRRNELFRDRFLRELSSGDPGLLAVYRSLDADLLQTRMRCETLVTGAFRARALLEYSSRFLKDAIAYAAVIKRERLTERRKNAKTVRGYFTVAFALLLSGVVLKWTFPSWAPSAAAAALGAAALLTALYASRERAKAAEETTRHGNELEGLLRGAASTDESVALMNIYKKVRSVGHDGPADEAAERT